MAVSETLIIDPRVHDLGSFSVRRALPHARARHVGPFFFFDHMGPAQFAPGQGMDVRPHPHIGLATVTYLFAGTIAHRDNLGNVQTIRPGEVNWMTAGRGIVHSERTPSAERASGQAVHGIQTWVALPHAAEEAAPSFQHCAAGDVPQIEIGGVRLRLIAGNAFGAKSPIATFSTMFYLAAEFSADTAVVLSAEHVERGVYATDAPLWINGVALAPAQMVILAPGKDVEIRARSAAHALFFGGDPLDGERYVWWNFVSSTRERIERAKVEWAAGRMPAVPGETEFIALPER